MHVKELRKICLDHLMQFQPKLYQQLLKDGDLDAHLNRAVRETTREMDAWAKTPTRRGRWSENVIC